MKALFTAVINGMETKTFTKDNGETFERVIIKRDYSIEAETEEHKILSNIVFGLTDEMKTDTAYEIVKTACDLLDDALANEGEMDEDEFAEWVDGLDLTELACDGAPMYTCELLALIDSLNYTDIQDLIKDGYDMPIAVAAWYEMKVEHAMRLIVDETA